MSPILVPNRRVSKLTTYFSINPYILIKAKIIAKTRSIGRANLYKLNPDSEIARQLVGLDDKITDFFGVKGAPIKI